MVIENGKVAMKYYQPIPKDIQIGKEFYRFRTKKNISMAWVLIEHVDRVLAIRRVDCSSCGGNLPIFRYASESNVRVWEGRAER
jgi:hypothetical protein